MGNFARKAVDPVKIGQLIEPFRSDDVAPDSLDFGGASYEAVEAMDAICKTLAACIESTQK